MRVYNYRFAGLDISLQLPEELEFSNEHHLAPFRTECVAGPHVFTFCRVETLTAPAGEWVYQAPSFWVCREDGQTARYLGILSGGWQGAHIRVTHRGRLHTVELKADAFSRELSSRTVLEVLAAEHLLVQNGSLILHCSFVERNGKAVLFTAPSETGKSTQADLWHRYRGADIVNGDRAAIRLTGDGRILAEGIPFAGSSKFCKNRSLPLEAIVYLAQAPRTTVRRMGGREAFARLWEGVTVNTWDRTDVDLASCRVLTLAEKIPLFYMPCTPDEGAVTTLERELNAL